MKEPTSIINRFTKPAAAALLIVVVLASFVQGKVPRWMADFLAFRERSKHSLPHDSGQSAIVAGELSADRPTINCLGFNWSVTGDDNRNAHVAVQYRRANESQWHDAQPLLRQKNEVVGRKSLIWKTPNAFAGSIMDLQPNTTYQVKLTLSDPDGGDEEKQLTLQTRQEPTEPDTSRALIVKPTQLQAQYEQAEPNTVLLLAPGIHQGSLSLYRDVPITIVGSPGAVIDGDGNDVLIDATGSRGLRLHNVTLRNAGTLIRGGDQLTVTQCTFEKPRAYGIYNADNSATDVIIADCTFLGPLTYDWSDYSNKGKTVEPHGVELRGAGHVIAYNRFERWWDAIRLAGSTPPADAAKQNAAIDIFNNHISRCSGDGIELDYGVRNLRAVRNFVINCYGGISAQPVYGGPAYISRNFIINVKRYGVKLNQAAAGILIYHNTILMGGPRVLSGREWANVHLRNNLILGRDLKEGLIWTGTPLPELCSFDYNGWREMKNNRWWWRFPEKRRSSGGSMSYEGVFPTLQKWSQATGYEGRGRVVDYDCFQSARMPDDQDSQLTPADLQIRQASAAIDAGIALTNINDGYSGAQPDLGALEYGADLPTFGPRVQQDKP